MKQLIQNYKTGELSLEEVPVPLVRPGWILVKTLSSAISIGSEKAVVEFAQKSLAAKAASRPDLVRQVVNRAKKEGIVSTIHHAMNRLDTPLPMGYSSCGKVIETGQGSSEFKVGDTVALNGTGYGSHAEYAVVPFNLAAKVPDGVLPEHAAFGAIGGIAMEGARNIHVEPGSVVAVFGLGLIGLLAAQILSAYGYQVIGIDPDTAKQELAKQLGVNLCLKPDENLTDTVKDVTDGHGVDASIICAATKDSRPISQSADICRYRGRIVMVGVTEMTLDRRQFYDKELSFTVSKSTGPGKGDPVYEIKGTDYPPGLVRWTEKRNIKEFLRLISENKINISNMITHRLSIEESVEFYHKAAHGEIRNLVGAVITYPEESRAERKIWLRKDKSVLKKQISAGLIGAGLFAKNVLYPILKKETSGLIHLRALATASGVSSNDSGKKFEVDYITTDYHEILNDPEINVVFIATRHSEHAAMIIDALKAGKSVFVEKPLATSPEELHQVEEAYKEYPGEVMTGFCRRYSPSAQEMIRILNQITAQKIVHYRINAGAIPSEHWVQQETGGRIIGEVCHFIDLACALTESLPAEITAACLTGEGDLSMADNLSIVMRMGNGSIGNILYCSNGDKSFSREYIEVYSGGQVVVNEDFRRVTAYGKNGKKSRKWGSRDMGYKGEIEHFIKTVSKKEADSVFSQDAAVTQTTFAILQSLSSQKWIDLNQQGGKIEH